MTQLRKQVEYTNGFGTQQFTQATVTVTHCGLWVALAPYAPRKTYKNLWAVYDNHTGYQINNQLFEGKPAAVYFAWLLCSDLGWNYLPRHLGTGELVNPNRWKIDVELLEAIAHEHEK